MDHRLTCIVAWLVLQSLWPGSGHAADPAGTRIEQEVSKEEAIYRSKGPETPDGYTVDRSLSDYVEMLADGFARDIANLGPQDRWLDIGAGEAKAILDYYTPAADTASVQKWLGGRARATAISREDRRTAQWRKTEAGLGPDRIRYLSNHHLRDYSAKELGQFQLVTDVIGGFSYAEDLSLFMEKALGLLALDGSFYTVLADVRSEDGSNKPYYAGSPFSTEITNADGSEQSVCSWLKSITCVEVRCEAKAGWKPPIEAFQLRKTCEQVQVPALKLLGYEASTPPGRRYRAMR